MPYAINPGERAETLYGSACASQRPPLFDFAPSGVFHAKPVARLAVGSYPTFSPLPNKRAACNLRNRRYNSLWHFP
jgi:hypothetical protein